MNESDRSYIAGVFVDAQAVVWLPTVDGLSVQCQVPRWSETLVTVRYGGAPAAPCSPRLTLIRVVSSGSPTPLRIENGDVQKLRTHRLSNRHTCSARPDALRAHNSGAERGGRHALDARLRGRAGRAAGERGRRGRWFERCNRGLVEEYARRHLWIHLVRRGPRADRSFSGKCTPSTQDFSLSRRKPGSSRCRLTSTQVAAVVGLSAALSDDDVTRSTPQYQHKDSPSDRLAASESYRYLGHTDQDFPESLRASTEIVSLPMFPN